METIPLSFPITVDGQSIIRIQLRRPKVKDILLVRSKATQAEQEMTLIAALSEPPLTVEQIQELDFGDYQRVQQILGGLFPVQVPQRGHDNGR